MCVVDADMNAAPVRNHARAPIGRVAPVAGSAADPHRIANRAMRGDGSGEICRDTLRGVHGNAAVATSAAGSRPAVKNRAAGCRGRKRDHRSRRISLGTRIWRSAIQAAAVADAASSSACEVRAEHEAGLPAAIQLYGLRSSGDTERIIGERENGAFRAAGRWFERNIHVAKRSRRQAAAQGVAEFVRTRVGHFREVRGIYSGNCVREIQGHAAVIAQQRLLRGALYPDGLSAEIERIKWSPGDRRSNHKTVGSYRADDGIILESSFIACRIRAGFVAADGEGVDHVVSRRQRTLRRTAKSICACVARVIPHLPLRINLEINQVRTCMVQGIADRERERGCRGSAPDISGEWLHRGGQAFGLQPVFGNRRNRIGGTVRGINRAVDGVCGELPWETPGQVGYNAEYQCAVAIENVNTGLPAEKRTLHINFPAG